MTTKTFERKGIPYDSNEELYFSAWLDELQEAGFIDQWERDIIPFELTSGLEHFYNEDKVLKTKVNRVVKRKVLLRPSEYTPDFYIRWNDKANKLFCTTLNSHDKITTPFIAHYSLGFLFSYVEIKPDFDMQNMERGFIIKQKVVWDKHKVYVNLTHIKELFKETFTPYEYTLTPTGKVRKLNWTPKTLADFLMENK